MKNKQTKQSLIAFEERIKDIYSQGQIRGPIHLSSNNEDVLINIFSRVNPDDWVFTTYRNHSHALLKGIPETVLEDMIVDGHSMHLMSKQHKFVSSSIVAGHIPMALGAALALKRKGAHNRVWTFCGDMAAETGVFHEATKYAINHDLPITFIVEDNGLGVDTPTKQVWGETDTGNSNQNLAVVPVITPIEDGGLARLLDRSPKVLRYNYQRGYKHHGVGVWITFPEEKDKSTQHLDDYHRETNAAMKMLANEPNSLFMGQTVAYPGSPIFKSLDGIPQNQRLELPVIEETQMGMSIGLALEDYLPVSIFPRFDFMISGTNQLVNHLDKMYELSQGQFDPKVIIRTTVGTKRPINPGPQHYQDHTEAFEHMLTNVDVIRVNHASRLVPAYQRALSSNHSSLIVESDKLFYGDEQ